MKRWRDGGTEGGREGRRLGEREKEWRKRSLPSYILNFLSSEWLKKIQMKYFIISSFSHVYLNLFFL